MTRIWVPREQHPGERRVAATPETVKRLIKDGLAVTVESGAGEGASHSDEDYRQVGAEITADRRSGWQGADLVFKVREPSEEEAGWLRPGAILLALMAAHKNLARVEQLAKGGVTTFAMELVPRITRAQSLDALSSQASITGYKAVLIAAARLPKYFPLLMTAAGTVPPARVVVMGAGVAGLQAIATARRLGAVVEVSDIRAAVKEEIESLGGRFIELPTAESGDGQGGYAKEMSEDFLRRQREIVARHLAAADVVITTALVPGRPAPRLVSREMVEGMKKGSIIVDLASSEGGNCELSRADEEVMHGGVLILAPSNLASAQSVDASALYAKNLVNLLALMWKKGELTVDTADEVLAGTLLTHQGSITHAPTAARLGGGS